MQINSALAIQINLIGYSGYIIRSLGISIGIGYNPLTTGLEILEGIAQLLGCGGTIECGLTTLDIDTLDILIILCLADAGNQIVETHRASIAHT